MFKKIVSILLIATCALAAPTPRDTSASFDIKTASTDYIAQKWGVPATQQVLFDSSFSGPQGSFAFLRQAWNGVPIVNSPAAVVYDTDNNVVSYSGSHRNFTYVETDTPTVTLAEAVASAQNAVGGTWDGANPEYAYVAKDNGQLAFAYVLHVTSTSSSTPYLVYINGVTGTIDEVVNQQTTTVVVSQ